MAGRPQSKTRRKAALQPVLDTPEPRVGHLARNPDRTAATAAVRERSLQRYSNGPVRLSAAYRDAMSVEVTEKDIDPDSAQTTVLQGLKARNGGKCLLVADLLASALVRRAVDPASRDSVLALKELADRTEGPVTQKIESASVRYVVSLTPGGGVGAPTLTSPEDWERLARADWDAAQPGLPPSSQGSRGGGA